MLFGEVERAGRYNRPLSVGFVDIDLFKAVNDSHGHHVGDVVLRGVADMLRANVRATDMLGRYGGEEFMLILPETTVEDAASLADKLRLLVEAARFRIDDSLSVNVTVSIGVAGGPGGNLRIDTLVRDADAAMYSAKSLGRNQVYVFSEPNDDARVPRAPISSEGRARATDLARLARLAAEQALVATLDPLPEPSRPRVGVDRDAVRGHGPPDGAPRARGRPHPAGCPAPRRRQAGPSGGDPGEAVRAHGASNGSRSCSTRGSGR